MGGLEGVWLRHFRYEVCVSNCPRTFVNSTRTPGPIVTGEALFDSPIRRNDDGADIG